MRTLWLMFSIAVVTAVFTAPAAAAGPRYGVVADMQAIENRGDDESQTTQTKRKVGSVIGTLANFGVIAAGKGSTATVVAASAAPAAGEYAATKIGDQGPATRYMVKVKLDSGKTLAVTQLREQLQGIKVGSRVRVEGKGDSALVYAE